MLEKQQKNIEIVFIRNGLMGGGLSIACAIQANYLYQIGFNVTIIIDQAYSEENLKSKNAQLFNENIKIVSALTSPKYKYLNPQVKRRADKKSWFGGTISSYYDEYGVLIKKAYHDMDKQRVKISIPILEEYLSNLKKGDIVIAMEVSLGWYLGNLQLPKGVSKIYQHHNQHFYLSPWIDNSNNFNSIVMQTEKTKEKYEEMYGKKDNITIIGNPLRIAIPKNIMQHKERPLKIIVVGRLSDGKQPMDSIKAFEIIHQNFPESYLEFYGDGDLKSTLEDYIVEKDLRKSVSIKGYENNLVNIFQDASLMLMPTKRESFGMVILEAFAYGVPVVAYSTIFGVDDLIDNNHNGYLIRQGDYQQMAQQSLALLANTNKRDIFAKNGRQILEAYNYESIMNKHFRLIKKVSQKEINIKNLKYNFIERLEIPKQMKEYIKKKKYTVKELEQVIEYLKEAKAMIINGKPYIYNKKLVDELKIPLNICKIN